MKALKILGVVIGLLLVIFLLAGLVKPEVNYSTEVTVNKPLQEVFAKYNDLDNLNKWLPEVTFKETINETENKIGNQYKMVVESQGEKLEMIETVDDFIVNEKVALSFEVGDMVKKDITRFKSNGNTMTIKLDHSCQGTDYFHKCMFAFFGSAFKKIDQSYDNKFRDWAER